MSNKENECNMDDCPICPYFSGDFEHPYTLSASYPEAMNIFEHHNEGGTMKLDDCQNCYTPNDGKTKPYIFDRRTITLENTKNYIPMFEGRPKRDMDIGQEDILNLQIALNTTSSVSDFVKAV